MKAAISGADEEEWMTGTKKTGKGKNTKGTGKKTTVGARPAISGKQMSAQKRAADDLRRSEEKYRDLFENAMDAICIIDRNQNYVDVNKCTIELFGYSREELLAMNVRDMLPPGQLARSEQEFAKLIDPGAYDKFTGKVRRKDGSYIDVEVSSSAIVEQGQVVGSRDIIRDISERKQTEEMLSIKESAIAAANSGIALADLDGKLTYVNKTFLDMWGYASEHEVLGRSTLEFWAEPEAATTVVSETTAVGQWSGELTARRHDGSNVPMRLSANVVKDNKGMPICLMASFIDMSEQKLTENALRESENRYREIVEGQTEFVVRYKPGGIITFVNDTLCQYTKMKREDLLGRSYYPFMHPDDRDTFIRKIEALDRKSPEMVAEARVVLPDGREAWHQWTHHAIFNDKGTLIEYQATGKDVTELRKAQERIKESEKKYRNLFESLSDGILIVDLDGSLIDANPLAYQRLGYTKEEFLSRKINELTAPEFAAKVPDRIKQIREQGATIFETGHIRKDGSIMPVEVNSRLIEHEGRTVLFSVVRDITERKRTQLESAEREAMLRQIMDTTSVAIGLVDMNGRITHANRRMAEMFGHTMEDLIGCEYVELVHPSERETGRKNMLALLASEISSVDLERHYWRKDGTEFWGHLACRRFYDIHDNELGLIGVISDISERKQAEDALRKSEKMLHTIIDAEPECVKLLDENACLIMMNRAGLDMLQVDSLEQVKGQCVCPMVTSDYQQAFLDLTKRVFKGESGTLFFEMVGMKGRQLWLETHAAPLRNEKDEIIACLGITRDVTERKRAEEELREKENKYRTLFEAANDGIFIQDETGFTDVNQKGADMYGLPREKLLGRSPAEFAPERQPDGRLSSEVAGEKIQAALNGIPQVFEWQPVRADGSPFDVEITLSRLEVDGNMRLQAIVRDITERRRAEDALRQSEARFRDLAESLPLTVFEVDLQHRFTYLNRAALETFGYSQQEFDAGLNIIQMVAPGDRDRALEVITHRLTGNVDGYREYLGLRKNGTTFPVTVASNPILRDGRPVGLRGIVSDLSERKRLEEELLKSQKLESIGTLAGGIAHDFNNLLQGIFGYISMAKLTIDQREKSLAMLEQAEKALHQSVNLTSQLLTFSKGGKPVKKVMDLRPVIENAVKFSLSGSRVSYDLSFGVDLYKVDADEGQIGQVVQNIVMNAEQSMPLGGRIEIAARNVPPARAAGLSLTAADGMVEIMVRDQGMGIPPEHLPRIFDPYFTTKEKGSGLGLATSYSIIRNHGGRIDVSSVMRKGSTFTITLPATRAAQEPTVSASAECAGRRTCRVLVMDDEPIVRVVAGELLRELGHDAEFAEHGDSAIEKYRRAMEENRPFDVVILDLTIRGGMGGMDTLRKLKEIDPGVKAVVSSGYSDDDVVATYRQHGFCAFLKKPYDMKELGRILDDVIAQIQE